VGVEAHAVELHRRVVEIVDVGGRQHEDRCTGVVVAAPARVLEVIARALFDQFLAQVGRGLEAFEREPAGQQRQRPEQGQPQVAAIAA
ncbi:hypothetical protein DF186_18015, partial [Enterococcus hirae]